MNRSKIRNRIEETLEARNWSPSEVRSDIGFHMTDWIEDLEPWVKFCSNPSAAEDEAVEELLIRFLVHVPNHLAAASKLMLDIPVTDVFGVGAVEISDSEAAT